MSRIDYDLCRLQAIAFDVDGVLSPSVVPMGADGIPQRMANLKDGYALQLAVKKGLKIAIITAANTAAVDARFRSLGIDNVYMGVTDKLAVFKQWLSENSLTPEQAAYAGDDMPDLQPMLHAGLSVAPADAAPDIRAIARFTTKAKGGEGAARELLEEVLKAKGLWPVNH